MRAMLTGALLETTVDPSVLVPQPDLSPAAVPDDLLNSGVINGWVDRLARFDRDVSDTERIDQLVNRSRASPSDSAELKWKKY